jgi:hypothetical protein
LTALQATCESFAKKSTVFKPVDYSSVSGAAGTSICDISVGLRKIALFFLVLGASVQLSAREKGVQYGMGLLVNLPYPEKEVEQVIQDVAQNGIIRGTKEYNKDEYVSGAAAATSTRVFPDWTEGGKVFYKVREHALDPRNFKGVGDVGTLAVRYVIQPQSDKNCVLHIDAAFVEDFRRNVHESNGSVESAEYKDIHDRLEAITSMKAEAKELERAKQDQLSKNFASRIETSHQDMSKQNPVLQTEPAAAPEPAPVEPSSPAAPAPTASAAAVVAPAPEQSLEDRVKDLRHQVQRRVKTPGTALKSAPFHSASTLQSLPPGADVLIVITTPYWFGVETHNGQHGWIPRDDLELLP